MYVLCTCAIFMHFVSMKFQLQGNEIILIYYFLDLFCL